MNDQEEKEYKVPFLVLKFGQQGLRLVEGQKNVVYVESSYKVMCTFHDNSIVKEGNIGNITETPENENDIFRGKHYTSLFKQSVYWDFGDGALVKGITATHNYSKAGKYIITCYFFDKENNSYKNSFKYEVIAKEVIDTGIILEDEHKNKEINVSKITHLCPLECRLGENINYPLPIVPYKKNSKEQQSFFDLKEDDICAKELFYSFYEKSNDNIFLSEKTKKTTLTPVQKYLPTYQHIFGFFGLKTEGSSTSYGLNLATVITQPRVDKKWLSIDLKIDGEEKEVPIRHFMSFDDMPQEYHYLGMRTFVDVFFHSDYNEGSSQVSYQFDLESSQVFNELKSSTNYINMLPKTQTLTVLPNNTERVKYAFSNDTILREVENSADMFFVHSFVKGLKQQVYFIPYIEYNKTDFGTKEVSPFYYIPKDIDISSYDINVALSKAEEKEIDQKWLRNIDVSYYDAVQFLAKNGDEVVAYIETQPTIDLESIIIPERNLHDENIPRMVDALTPNYAFNDAKNVKELLIGIFSQNNWLNKTITKMDSFYDDNNNPDKCYIPQLVSFLRSLNEKTDEFQNDFGNVNEVNELTRIISLQHTDLVGHENLVPMDISYDGEVKGTNVSDELRIDDVIYVNKSGFIVKVKRKVYEDDGKNWEYREYQMNPTNLIIWDCYTKTSKLASFFDVPHILLTDEEDLQPFCLKDYTDKWGWGLSLPERFFKTPILGNIRTNIITGYYRFFLLNPAVGKTRVGNYVQDNILNVSPKLLSPLSWDKDWDCCYEYILKTLHEKGLTITKEEQEDTPDEEALSFTIYDDYFIAFNFIEDVSIKTKRVRVNVSSTPEDTLVMFPHILSEITLSKYDNMSLLKKQFGENKIYFLELGEETKVICDNTSHTYNVSEPENPLSETYPLTSIKVYQGAKNGEEVFYSKHKMRVSGADKEFFIYKEHDTLEDAISTIDFKTALDSTTGIEEETIDLSNPEKEESQNKSFVPTLFSISNTKTISSEEFIWRT